MGSFRLVAGNRHLHRYYNFAGRAVETVKMPVTRDKTERPHGALPVSYTHLDVYKRQGLDTLVVHAVNDDY